ncbi:hypothetical protein [Planctomycetes bacterium Poly30]
MNRRNMLRASGLVGALTLHRATGSPWVKGPSGAGKAKDLERAAAILAAAESFGRGGGYDKSWSSSGCPAPVEHEGETILQGSAKGTYCCGWTFAVAMKALTDAGALKKKSAADLRRFQKVWFGATGVEEEALKQCALAVQQLGVGEEVKADEAMAGDFAQLWRKKDRPSGHSVLFLGWVEVAGERIGFSYLSSQGSTDGIGHAVEYFADAKAGHGRVDPERLYFARLAL